MNLAHTQFQDFAGRQSPPLAWIPFKERGSGEMDKKPHRNNETF